MLSLDFVVALTFIKKHCIENKVLWCSCNILDGTGLVHGMLSILQNLHNDDKMIDSQIEAFVIFTRNIEIDAEADFNLHHCPRKAPRRVDEQAETATVFSLQAYYRNQFHEVLDARTSQTKKTFRAMPEESFACVEMFENTS